MVDETGGHSAASANVGAVHQFFASSAAWSGCARQMALVRKKSRIG